MAERASEVRTLLPCPLCGRALIPMPVDSCVVFLCKSGHELPLMELLRAQSAVLQRGLEILLANWNREHLVLMNTIEDARRNGYLDVAQIFNRHAMILKSRIRNVRDAAWGPGSSQGIPSPNAVRSS